MTGYLAALAIVLLLGTVFARVLLLRRAGTGFALVLIGQVLVFPNWVPLVYLTAGVLLFHRQVLREEEFMRRHYGHEYTEYCRRARRYV